MSYPSLDPNQPPTARQREIALYTMAGWSINQIAHELFLSPATVVNHRSMIYKKIGAQSAAELLCSLLASGEITIDDIRPYMRVEPYHGFWKRA